MKRRCRRVVVGTPDLDRAFDRLVPDELRHLSEIHWTPVRIAIRAAALLCPHGSANVLDIGAGIGKLCSIGALACGGRWTGVEIEAPLVDGARRLARKLGVADRTSFIEADALSIDWSPYEALYFYNPFELATGTHPPSSTTIPRVQQRLAQLAPFTRVVTLHGFGGVMPSSFELVYHERLPSDGLDLALWQQGRATRSPSVA